MADHVEIKRLVYSVSIASTGMRDGEEVALTAEEIAARQAVIEEATHELNFPEIIAGLIRGLYEEHFATEQPLVEPVTD